MPSSCAQDHGGLRDAAHLGELGFDLAELDAKSAHLDLIIDPAVEGDIAVRVDQARRRQTVQNRVRHFGLNRVGDKRIGDKFLAR